MNPLARDATTVTGHPTAPNSVTTFPTLRLKGSESFKSTEELDGFIFGTLHQSLKFVSINNRDLRMAAN